MVERRTGMNDVRIHFTDQYGQGTIECTRDKWRDVLKSLESDPNTENFWLEFYDEEEGWQG
jgi:hypothetical protein